MNPILVTSTEEGTGKTAIAIALARHAQEGGLDVGYYKPKGTRLRSPVGKTRDEDPLLAMEMLGIEADISDLEPIVYSPSFVEEAIRGREDAGSVHERVREFYDRIADERDLVVVEGGGKPTTGSIVDLTDADVADLLDARAVLIASYEGPGDVDAVLDVADRFGDALAGVLFNAVSDANVDALTNDVIPFLEGRDLPVLGVLSRVQELAGVTVEELVAELGGDLLNPDVGTEAFVERFAVGAMGSDAALTHLRRLRNAALVTGGDRSEIQTAALEASGIKCIVLTGGLRPPGAVLGRATEAGVPVVMTRADTKATVDRLEELISTGRTRDADAVARMGDLLADHADLDALLGE